MLLTLLLFEYYVLYIVFISVLVLEEQENYGRDEWTLEAPPQTLEAPQPCVYMV